jgi:hypothetical protein
MKRIILVVTVFALLGFAASASAQPPIANPTAIEFTPSADHAQIDAYEVGWFLAGATSPVSTTDIGKPAPNAANVCRATINVMPLPFNSYTAKARAKAGTVYSDWSDPSDIFFRQPGKPGKPAPK